MTEPLDYRILQNLKTALVAISVAGGYYYDVAAGAVKLDPNADVEALIAPGGPRPLLLIEALPEDRQTVESPNGIRTTRKVFVHAVQDSDPTDDDSFELVASRLRADIETAARLDPSRGGLAYDTVLVTQDPKTELSPLVWIVTELSLVVYRTDGYPVTGAP